MRRFIFAMVALVAIPFHAFADCSAVVTEAVTALEDSAAQMNPGDDFGTPSQLQIVPGDQLSYICAHGGYCYPSGAITLNGCRIVPEPDPSASADLSEPIIFLLRSE